MSRLPGTYVSGVAAVAQPACADA
ncbi:hypothetical protein CBM2633_B90190 [Cupriavidus taiwanensis]|nr:hypothetical protein CBM2633_B90190 [Cupriavidus taiwanensis]